VLQEVFAGSPADKALANLGAPQRNWRPSAGAGLFDTADGVLNKDQIVALISGARETIRIQAHSWRVDLPY
jgi:hypothetical protein